MHLFCFKKQQNFNIFTSNVFAHAKSDISAVLKRKVHFSSALTRGATDLAVAQRISALLKRRVHFSSVETQGAFQQC